MHRKGEMHAEFFMGKSEGQLPLGKLYWLNCWWGVNSWLTTGQFCMFLVPYLNERPITLHCSRGLDPAAATVGNKFFVKRWTVSTVIWTQRSQAVVRAELSRKSSWLTKRLKNCLKLLPLLMFSKVLPVRVPLSACYVPNLSLQCVWACRGRKVWNRGSYQLVWIRKHRHTYTHHVLYYLQIFFMKLCRLFSVIEHVIAGSFWQRFFPPMFALERCDCLDVELVYVHQHQLADF